MKPPARRVFLAGLGASLVAGRIRAAAQESATAQESAAAQPAAHEVRSLELTNIHTGQTVRAVYKRGARYEPEALEQFRKLLRDRRNGAEHDIDAALYDQLFELARAAGREPRYDIISAYRSKESNDRMSARPGSGVSRKSLHMQGRAIDVRLKDFPTAKLRDLAIAAKKGGVGYYERSDFVHLDTGRFRTWVG
jgi:uncharacterized protein YcbK (DUF882 family)